MCTLDLHANGVACAFCREQPVAFRYRTVAVEMPTRDGGVFRDGEADWNVCATCADLVETRRWADLAERVYAVRAAATPPELREHVREAARRTVDLLGSAALAPRGTLVDPGGTVAPFPTPQELAAFAASLSGDDGDDEDNDEDGPELADWDWIGSEIERARAAGELQLDWVIGSDLSYIGEFYFARVRCRLNGEEGEVRVLSYHEFDGAWAIFPDVRWIQSEELELGPTAISPVLQRAEELVRSSGAAVMEASTDGA